MSQILKEREYSLKKSSPYRDKILDMVDIIRTKQHKYVQTVGEFADIRNKQRVCVIGLYNTEKGGSAYTISYDNGMYISVAIRLNDKGWTFNEIADELERGVALLR